MEKLEKQLNSKFYERTEIIRGLTLAALTGEHVFLLGPPGTAKSELARAFASSIGAIYFEWLLTRFTTPEELFGPVSLKALKEGSFQRVTTGKLPEAEIAFLDEIWKANSAILNALLTILNERVYHNNGAPMQVPLRTCIAASNELPEDDSLKALYDRLLLRFLVEPLSDESFSKLIMGSASTSIAPVVSIEDLMSYEVEIEGVSLPANLGDAYVQIRSMLLEEGVACSDRRFAWSIKLLKANAWLEGRAQAEEEDLEILSHVLWETPDQIKAVKKVVLKAANPILIKALELKEAAEAAAADAFGAEENRRAEAGVEAAARIKRCLIELKKLPLSPRLETIIQDVKTTQKQVITECLGLGGIVNGA